MNDEMDIGSALVDAVYSITRGHVIAEGTIQAVYTQTNASNDAFTADILIGGSVFYAVPLKVLVGSQASVIEVPVLNTTVLITFRDGNIQRPQVFMTDQVDKYLITCNLVEYNGGQLGGMVKVIDLTTKLNNLENLVNNLITSYNQHTHNVTAVGSPTGPNLSPEVQMLTPTQQSEIEDTKITH